MHAAPRISTHRERRHGLPSLTYRSSSGSSSISSISRFGSEDDQQAGIERREKDKQQRSTTIRAGRHSSDKVAKQCARSRGDRCKSQRSLNRHQIAIDPSSDPSSSDSDSSSSSSGGDRKRAKNKTKRYERKPHKTLSAPVKTKVYKRKQCSSSSSESSQASEVEQVMTTHVSGIQLRDFNTQGRKECLTRAINYLRSYPDISEATRVNLLYKKLPTEDRILLDMMRGTATREKAEEVLRKNYARSQMSDVQVALSGMHLASNEIPSGMLRKTLEKAHLSVPIMN